MNARLLIIIAIFILFPSQNVFAPPSLNPDWQDAPYCPGGCPLDHLKERWAEYYEIKGSEWMEAKKQEMLNAIENGTLNDWRNMDPTRSHYNVYTYYFYKGEVPNHEGKFIDQVAQEKFLSDIENNLKNNQFPLGGYTYINFTFLLAMVGGAVVGSIFVIKRTRK